MRCRVVPVLDLQKGVVVRGIAGRRAEYRPIVSQLTASTNPIDVAEAFRNRLGLTRLYVADLDAIGGQAPALATYSQLQARGFHLWVDAGLRDAADSSDLADVEGIVVGLETIRGPHALAAIAERFGAGRIVFSLDLKDGQPLGDTSFWECPAAEVIAAQAVRLGIRRMIVLDLARVGMGTGTGTDDLCQRLADTHPDLELVAGGGVRDASDLTHLARLGVSAALVASALHDGRLTAAAVQSSPRLRRG